MELSPQQDVYYIDTVSPTDYFIDTVTPNAIQLNKEKIMSIELDGPLYLGSNSMQQQVDQNTSDIADLKQDVSDTKTDVGSLGDLTTTDKSSLVGAINEVNTLLPPTSQRDYIDNSKAMLTGAASTNDLILPEIKAYAHSTFDRSKFTVTGETGLTDDGVIPTGITGGNYVAVNYKLPIWNNNAWEIFSPLYTIGTATAYWNTRYLLKYSDTGNGVFLTYVGVNGNSTLKISATFRGDSTITVEANITRPTTDSIQFKIKNTGTEYQLYSRLNGIGEWTLLNSAEKTNTFTAEVTDKMNFNYFSSGTEYAPVASCDLKYLKMVDNGLETLNGCKTGTDSWIIGNSLVTIPYVISNTGSKIVDSAYRTQLNALYDQEGFAPYYTLSDTDFTLPIGEIYGLMNRVLPSEWGGLLGNKVAKSIGIFGGSFATNENAKTAFDLWKEKLGVTCNSYAVGGAGFVNGTNFVTQATDAGVHDIYVIWCSTNDFANSRAIGTSADVYGTDSTCWANFKEVVRLCYSKNPNAKVCLLTSSPHLTLSQGNEEGRGTVTTYTNTLKEHVDAQKEMCSYYSLPCLDQYNNSQQNGFNYSLVCLNNDFHLSPYGYKLLANNQIDFLQKL